MLVVALISGCAAGGATNTRGEDITDLQESFKKGDIRLQCGLGCSGRWGANRTEMKRMHDNQLWKDLFAKVVTIGFETNLSYYYLGRIAEGEGYKDAAVEYYKQALAVSFKCKESTCAGFIFPQDIEYRLKIAQGLETEKPTQSVAPPIQTPPASAPSIKQTPMEVPPPELTAAERRQSEISSKIKTDFDDFKKISNYKGPEESWGNCDSIFLRAWKSDTDKEATYQIYVMDYYSGEWRFYSHAFDDDGNALDFTSISRDVGSCSRYGGCSHYEHLGINVSRKYLENRKDKGIKFKISGNAGEEVCALHSPYIKAFLVAVPSDSASPNSNRTPTKTSSIEPKVDSRTPEQRYEGAFLGGRLVCGTTYLLSKKIEEAKIKGISVDADVEKTADVGACIKKQLGEFQTEYKNFLALQKSKEAKSALTEHYVAAVLAIKSTSPFIGESGDSYKTRQEENKRKADEKWVRYELVK